MKLIKKELRPAIKRRKRKVPKEPRKRTRVAYSSEGITPHEWSGNTKSYLQCMELIVNGSPLHPSCLIYTGWDFGKITCIHCGEDMKTIHKGEIVVIEHCPKAQAAIMDSVLG